MKSLESNLEAKEAEMEGRQLQMEEEIARREADMEATQEEWAVIQQEWETKEQQWQAKQQQWNKQAASGAPSEAPHTDGETEVEHLQSVVDVLQYQLEEAKIKQVPRSALWLRHCTIQCPMAVVAVSLYDTVPYGCVTVRYSAL